MPVPPNVICFIPKLHSQIPAGWIEETRISGRYIKLIPTSGTNPGTQSGSDLHNHPSDPHGHNQAAHGHTWPNTAMGGAGTNTDGQGCPGGQPIGYIDSHAHAVTGDNQTVSTANDGPTVWSSVTDYTPYLLCIAIKSDGTPAGFPPDAILFSSVAAPSGWAVADGTGGTANAVDKIIRGVAVGGDGGANGGTGNSHPHTMTHAHAQTQHRHACSTGDASTQSGGNFEPSGIGGGPTNPHDHDNAGDPAGASFWSSYTTPNTNPATDTSTNGDLTPPWHKLLPIQNVSGTMSAPEGVLALWLESLASIPIDFLPRSDLANGRYVMGAANVGQVGTQGGNAQHGHSGQGHPHTNPTHNHNEATTSVSDQVSTGHLPTGCGLNWYPQHPHGSGGTSSNDAIPDTNSVTPTVGNTNNDPANITVALIELQVDLMGGGLFLASD